MLNLFFGKKGEHRWGGSVVNLGIKNDAYWSWGSVPEVEANKKAWRYYRLLNGPLAGHYSFDIQDWASLSDGIQQFCPKLCGSQILFSVSVQMG